MTIDYEMFQTMMSRVLPRTVQLQLQEDPLGPLLLLRERQKFLRAFYSPDGLSSIPSLAKVSPLIAEGINAIAGMDDETFVEYFHRFSDRSAAHGVQYLQNRQSDLLMELKQQVENTDAQLLLARSNIVALTDKLRNETSNRVRLAEQVEFYEREHHRLQAQFEILKRRLKHAKATGDEFTERRLQLRTKDAARTNRVARERWVMLHEGVMPPTKEDGNPIIIEANARVVEKTIGVRRDDCIEVDGLMLGSGLQVWSFNSFVSCGRLGLPAPSFSMTPTSLIRAKLTELIVGASLVRTNDIRLTRKKLGTCLGFVREDDVLTYELILRQRRKELADDLPFLLSDRQFIQPHTKLAVDQEARVAVAIPDPRRVVVTLQRCKFDQYFPPFWQQIAESETDPKAQ